MKAQILQQQLVFNSEKLTEMYAEYASLRKNSAMYNKRADIHSHNAMMYDRSEYFEAAEEAQEEANANLEQATVFTPFINKLRKRIAALESVQKALKQELKTVQMLEAFVAEDEAFWLEQAKVAQDEGYTEAVCNTPPSGWHCTREQWHDGPCAAWPSGEE